MKFHDRENIRNIFKLMPCILFFCSYFFPLTSFITAVLWHIYIAARTKDLKIIRAIILFSFFVSISGLAVKERDEISGQTGFSGSVTTPSKIELYKKELESFSHKLKNRELVTALTTGSREFSDRFRNDLVNTGTMHIVAISAFHVGMMLIMINFIFKLSGAALFLKPRYFAIFSLILKLALSFYYFYITGASIPTLRALFFMLMFDIYILTGRNPHSITMFLYSITAVCIAIPSSVTSISFIMSALCVAVIINIWSNLPRSVTVKLITVSIMMNYILIPVSAAINGTFPLFSPLVNLFVIPVISLSLPFITAAQFIVPFSVKMAGMFLNITDFLISPAYFIIGFAGETAERSLIPLIEPSFYVKLMFVSTFFGALFLKKIRAVLIVCNLTLLVPFHVNLSETTVRPAIFYGKVLCIKESSGEGHLIFDKYKRNPSMSISFRQKVEKGASECGIRKLISIHFPQNTGHETLQNFRKRMRMRSVNFYSLDENRLNGEDLFYEPYGPDHGRIRSQKDLSLRSF